jgi:phosphohistidine phosphatase
VKVVLLRHGIAVDRSDLDGPADEERPLTPKGTRRTREACRGLATLDVEPDLVLTSPLVRARQTAEIAAEVLGGATVEETSALSGGTQTREIFEVLAGLAADTVVCVGHAPQLDVLLAEALRGTQDAGLAPLKKAGAARVDFEAPPAPAGGRLVWLQAPRALRALGRG